MQTSQSSCEKSLPRNSASLLLNDIIILGDRETGWLYPRHRGDDIDNGYHPSLPLSNKRPACSEADTWLFATLPYLSVRKRKRP